MSDLQRRLDNANAQIAYMVREISEALGVKYDSPADAVTGVRALMNYAEALKAERSSTDARGEHPTP